MIRWPNYVCFGCQFELFVGPLFEGHTGMS
jgi:hypothetical protein